MLRLSNGYLSKAYRFWDYNLRHETIFNRVDFQVLKISKSIVDTVIIEGYVVS